MSDKVNNNTFRWVGPELTVMSAKASTGVGTEQDVKQFGWIGVAMFATGFTGTIKCQGSFKKIADVNFANAAALNNLWDYIAMYDYEDSSLKDGDTGIVFAGAVTECRMFTVNATELRSINFEVTARAAGSINVFLFPVNNQ